MIVYLVSARWRSANLSQFLLSWGHDFLPWIKIIPYDALPRNAELPGGTYIFGDFDFLKPAQASLAARIWDQLARAADQVRLLNHPQRSLQRYELLRTLSDGGTNEFAAYRATEQRTPRRFPVFLRHQGSHAGALSSFLSTQEELDRAILTTVLSGVPPHDILVVEFCDTADHQGTYRKYGAVRIGDRIIPSHLRFSQDWQVKLKTAVLEQESWIKEQRNYLETNPHAEQLRTIFELARIEYGRIDYSFQDGRMQVWEIDSNPILLQFPTIPMEEDLVTQAYVAPLIRSAFEAINFSPEPCPQIPLDWRQLLATIQCDSIEEDFRGTAAQG